MKGVKVSMKINEITQYCLVSIVNEAVQILQNLISIDTSQGSEIILAKYVDGLLSKEGLSVIVSEPVKGRGSLVAHLTGGKSSPLVLLSHLDTAPANITEWPFSPYSGELKDGWIQGRGAIDCKGLLAVHLAVIFTIKRLGLRLNRDLFLVSSAGEEEGGVIGTSWLLAKHPKLKTAEYILGEGGGFGFETKEGQYQLCQVGEKGKLAILLRSRMSYSKILYYASKVAQKYSYFEEIQYPSVLTEILDMNRIQHNNVWVDHEKVTFELLPTIDLERILRDFTKFIKREDSDFHLEVLEWTEGTISNKNSFLYEVIRRETRKMVGNDAVPYITPGYSDNRFFRRLGIKVYGYQPLLPHCRPSWVHGINEKISISSLEFGIKLLFKIITKAFIEK